MSEEKQIEEMENDIVGICPDLVESGCGQINCVTHLTLSLYKAGYRKQSEGEWVKVLNHKECSRCGYNAPYKKSRAGYHLRDLSNFCPNCGAKMKGGVE